MNNLNRSICFVILFLIATNIVKAQSPSAINFQGLAMDSNSKIISKKDIYIKCTFLVNKAAETSYAEIHKTTTDQFGQFNISLGLGKATVNTFDKLDWANNQYDLKVEISNDSINYKLLGRQQILSVPYALNAGNGLPKGKSKGATAFWDGIKWIVDSTIYNDGKRVKVGLGSSVDTTATLEVKSTTGGFLLPRLTESQRDSIKNPAEGLLIFCTDYYGSGKGGAVQIYNRGKWLNMFMPTPGGNYDCPYLYDIQLNGNRIIDSIVTISYKLEAVSNTTSDVPLIQWYRKLRDTTIKTSIVYYYYQIPGETKASYKISDLDNLGIRVSLIPRNKKGADCLIGDSIKMDYAVLNYKAPTTVIAWKSKINNYGSRIWSGAAISKRLVTDALSGNFMYTFPDSRFNSSGNTTWSYYNSINEINFLINSIEVNNTPDSLKSLLGELYAYRGYFYFELYRAFSINNTQGIPILENYDDLTTGNLSRKSADAVFTYIISTLDKAESLTADFTDSRGFSNLAINVLKSKVFLYKKDYASIITTFQKINSKYSLAKYPLVSSVNYITQLNDTSDFSKFNEIIYQAGGQYASTEYGRNTHSNNNATASTTGFVLNDSIANLFSTTDIRKSLIVKGALNGKFYFNKYLPYPTTGYTTSYNKEIKMADYYLIYAEAQARLLNTAEALTWLNKVAVARDPNFITYNSTSTSILSDIIKEKKKENLLEGDFYFDMIRFTNGNPGFYFSSNYALSGRQALSMNYYKGLPIPSSVLSTNPGLTQTAGW
jgi:hypothetical protein